MSTDELRQAMIQCVRSAGKILLGHFGRIREGRPKESQSSVVTDADLAAEEWIVGHLGKRFPDHGIVAEESGYRRGTAEFTWVIDPLDGTSNFVAGLPWFGAQIGVLQGAIPILAAMYLPTSDVLYVAERGKGAYVGDRPLVLTAEGQLRNVLCAFGFDASGSEADAGRDAALLCRVARGVRNIRTTNSLIDFCYTLEGRLGGCINLNTKVWDIVPVSLMLPEAGGVFTDLQGAPIAFHLDAANFGRTYAVVGGSRILHPQLVALTKERDRPSR